MAEHGGDVSDVFGDPKVYAAALELPDTAKLSAPDWARAWLPAILIFLGVSLLLNGVVSLFGAGGLPVVSLGVLLIVMVLAGVAIFRFSLFRVMVGRPVTSGLVLFAFLAGAGLLAAILPGPTLDIPAAVSIPGGGIVFGLGAGLLYRVRRRAEANGVTFPGG